MAHRAEAVAETIIEHSRKRNIEVTNLKLQKLVYYAQAWNLALRNRAIFNEAIEAWVHGPVVPSVFRRYKEYRWRTIDSRVSSISDADLNRHIDYVLDSYGSLDATQLERLTHREDPWKLARIGVPSDEPSHNIITTENMRLFYRTLINA